MKSRSLAIVAFLAAAVFLYLTLVRHHSSPSAGTVAGGTLKPEVTQTPNSAFPAQAALDVVRAREAALRHGHLPSYAREFENLHNPSENPLHLTSPQIAILQEAYNSLYTKRLELEASLAEASTINGDVMIEIPPYSKEGQILKDDFFASLTSQLGSEAADEINGEYLAQIEADNSYLGQRKQTLLVSIEPSGDTKVVHKTIASDGFTSGLKIGTLGAMDYANYGALAQLFPPHPPPNK